MHRRILTAFLVPVALIALAAPPTSAVPIDGRLEPDYGPALSTQTTQTEAGDNSFGVVNEDRGSELDQGYGFISAGVLYLFFSGNATFDWTLEGQTLWHPLDLFIDAAPGGQNPLLGNNPAPGPLYDLNRLAGLRFDSGFAPDYWLSIGGNLGSWPHLQAYYGELPAGGGGAGAYLGFTQCGGPGTLAGGSNPHGILATIDERNTAGVGFGCGAASGAGVATGIELAIPLGAIGNPTGCVRVCAFLSWADHTHLFNQVLGPLPPGTCSLGAAGAVDFASIPGNQYFTICAGPTAAHPRSWGSLKSIYR
jgi:hypothetical protein